MRNDLHEPVTLQRLVAPTVLLIAAICFLSVRMSSYLTSVATANGDCVNPVISADGKTVAFASDATNIVSGDRNAQRDVYLRELASGHIQLVSRDSFGRPLAGNSDQPAINTDGSVVAFVSDAPARTGGAALPNQIWVTQSGRPARLVTTRPDGRPADGASSAPALSDDGRWLAFTSTAPDLIPSDTNRRADVFVKDLHTGAIERVSLSTDGRQATRTSFSPSISGDGRMVAFVSGCSQLDGPDTPGVHLYIRDRVKSTTRRIQAPSDCRWVCNPRLSADGTLVAFEASDGPGQKPQLCIVQLDTGHQRILPWPHSGRPMLTSIAGGTPKTQTGAPGNEPDVVLGVAQLTQTGDPDGGLWLVYYQDERCRQVRAPSGSLRQSISGQFMLCRDGSRGVYHANGPDVKGHSRFHSWSIYTVDLSSGARTCASSPAIHWIGRLVERITLRG